MRFYPQGLITIPRHRNRSKKRDTKTDWDSWYTSEGAAVFVYFIKESEKYFQTVRSLKQNMATYDQTIADLFEVVACLDLFNAVANFLVALNPVVGWEWHEGQVLDGTIHSEMIRKSNSVGYLHSFLDAFIREAPQQSVELVRYKYLENQLTPKQVQNCKGTKKEVCIETLQTQLSTLAGFPANLP